MGKRSDFGENWAAVVAEWGLGTPLPVAADSGWAALDALERLYPARLDRVLTGDARGVWVLAPLIALGQDLAACEHLNGIGPVLARLRATGKDGNGRRSAAAELRFAAALVALGYHPRLEPSLGAKKPDGLITTSAGDVYYEVIAPAISAKEQEALRTIREPLDTLLKTGRKRQQRYGNDAIRADLERLMQPAEIYVEVPNEQGVHLFEDETRHFSRETMNIVIMDVSALPYDVAAWVPVIARRFQPNQNRRIGAVVIMRVYNRAPVLIPCYIIVPNPHASKPVPNNLLNSVRALDRRTALQTES